MKKITLTSILIAVLAINISAQEVKKIRPAKERRALKKIEKAEVPKEIVQKFVLTNPQQQVVQWSFYPYYYDLNSDDYVMDTVYVMDPKTKETYMYQEFYEVEFVKEGKTNRSRFSKTGNYLHSRRSITDAELPIAVSESFMTSPYSSWTVVGEKEILHLKEPGSTLYKIKLENGKEKQVLYYDQNGKLIHSKKV